VAPDGKRFLMIKRQDDSSATTPVTLVVVQKWFEEFEAHMNLPDPSHIMQVGMGFWASKVLLSAVRLKLFTFLGEGRKSTNEVKEHLNLQTSTRHVCDWLDALVSLGFLQRDGIMESATYSNTPATAMFLDSTKDTYMGGILEMANNRLYRFWGDLEEGLMTGRPQNESKHGNMHFFEELYRSPEKLHEFMDAMSGFQGGNFMVLVKAFDFSKYRTVVDLGGADGFLCCTIAQHHPGVTCTTYDLPSVKPLAEERISRSQLQDRVSAANIDIEKAASFPLADVVMMGNVLHGYDEPSKQRILRKAYDAVNAGGVFIAIENVIDDERRKNTLGMLMSLNMLIENGDGFDYSHQDFRQWASAAGFRKTDVIPLAGPTSAAIAYK
jgi:O-methyltransferase domain/Dimerisation domain